MTPEKWGKVKEILRQLQGGEGELEELAEGDAEVAQEARSLLEAMGRAEGFLETGLAAGTRVGNYRIVRQIGEGGMADVYLGERADGAYEKEVAVKVLRRGLPGEEGMRRFRQERQMLADLEHPHIVRLLDGGITEGGAPYLVMDYVEGAPLTEYAERRGVTGRAALELFGKVCEAVGYAHGRGILHRDLKPTNILVTERGEPRLLDFGVAKLLDEEGEAEREKTDARVLVWTPAYASPEQASCRALTAASDVYSLGLILYELLTGECAVTPGGDLRETIVKICEEEIDLRGIRRPVRRVLERCLRKRPEERYADAGEVAAALRKAEASLGKGGAAGRAPGGRGTRWLVAGGFAAALAGAVWMTPWGGEEVVEAGNGALTWAPEGEWSPSLSASANRLAYVRAEGVWVRELGGAEGTESRVCCEAGIKAAMSKISPEGNRVLVSHGIEGDWKIGLYRLAEQRWEPVTVGGPEMMWLADGKRFLYSRPVREGGPRAMFEHRLEDGAERQVSYPPEGGWGDIAGAASKDGLRMVVARYRDVGHGDIYLGEYGGRAMERVTRLDNWVVGLDWLPDHRHVVFGGTTEKAVGMQMLDTVTREVRLLPSTSVGSQYPVASEMADGRVRIVFVKESQGIDVETYGADGKLAYRIHQRAQEENPTLGDSGRLIYVSDRDGGFDLWTCQRPCAESRRITNHKEKTSEMAPHISPDERTVAYVHAEEGKQEVRTAAVEGGESRVLYAGPVAAAPSWSCDGKRVYFRAMAAGRAEIWSIDAAGETAPAQETRGGAGYAYASRDCRYLYYSGSGEGSWIVRRELATGQEQRLAHPATLRGDRWRVGGNAVHFLDMEESGGRYSMKRVSPEAAPQTVMTIGAGVEAYSFAANARGEVALCFRGQAMADIYYVDVKKERRSGLGF